MKLHFEEEDLTERQECSALTSNLEGTALNCVMAGKQYQPDTAEKIFEILSNRFGSGVQGHLEEIRDRHLLRQELEHRIRNVRISDPHITSGDSSKRLGQGSISRP